jgi:hypothetical protein
LTRFDMGDWCDEDFEWNAHIEPPQSLQSAQWTGPLFE